MTTLLHDPLEVISKLSVCDIREATAFKPKDVEEQFNKIRCMSGVGECQFCKGDLAQKCKLCPGFFAINSAIKDQCASIDSRPPHV